MRHERRSPPIADFINGIGQKQTSRVTQARSASPLKTDIAGLPRHVCSVPWHKIAAR